jgi:hypothetical protein
MSKFILLTVAMAALCSACHRAHVYIAPTHTTSVEIDLRHHHHHHR